MFTLVRYRESGQDRVGALVKDRVHDVTALLGGAPGAVSLLDHWEARFDTVADAVERGSLSGGSGVESVELLAPLRPTNLYCAFANYGDHIEEMGGGADDIARLRADDPFVFQVPTSAVIGPRDTAVVHPERGDHDWEGELALVVGREARDVSVEDALGCLAGYMVANDLSIRGRHLMRGPFPMPDFITMKGQAGFKPLGPGIVPARYVEDPQCLPIVTTVNGVTKQDSSTSRMIFTAAEIVSWLSTRVPLLPGDVIATGTPAGVGAARREFLADGDVVEVTVGALGTLRTPIAFAVPNR